MVFVTSVHSAALSFSPSLRMKRREVPQNFVSSVYVGIIMTGYRRVAEFMSTHGEVAILRRFGKLNMLSLLYSQAEITRLEHELNEVASQNPNITSARDWVTFCNSPEDHDKLQYQLALELQEKLIRFSWFPPPLCIHAPPICLESLRHVTDST